MKVLVSALIHYGLNLFLLFVVIEQSSCQFNGEHQDCNDLSITVVPGRLQSTPSSLHPKTRKRSDEQEHGHDRLDKYIFQLPNGQMQTLSRQDFEIVMRGPAQIHWSYQGPKNPGELGLIPISDKSGDCHSVRLTLRRDAHLTAEDTGLYSASYVSNPAKKVSLYLYVPNKYPPYLLSTEHLVTVSWREGKPLTLPCLLNNPYKPVFLSKRKGLNEWEEISSPTVNYAPDLGFTIKKHLNGESSFYGSYKCTTSLHNRNDTIFIYVGSESERV